MFEKARIGDRLWDFLEEWGTIVEVYDITKFTYPIEVKFDNGKIISYTLDGKIKEEDSRSRLFWDKLNYEIPKKRFSLESAFRMLEETNFDEGSYDNYYIFYNATDNKLDYDSTIYRKFLGIKFFTKESILKFFEEIEFNKISEQEFFDAYNKVFGGK